MRFLLDEDVYGLTACFLKQLGYNVVCVSEIGYSQAADLELVNIAQKQDRILITRDRDFGELVFVRNLKVGVIYLRILPSTLSEGHKELKTVLTSYSEDELKMSFIVVEPGRHRIRRLLHKK